MIALGLPAVKIANSSCDMRTKLVRGSCTGARLPVTALYLDCEDRPGAEKTTCSDILQLITIGENALTIALVSVRTRMLGVVCLLGPAPQPLSASWAV